MKRLMSIISILLLVGCFVLPGQQVKGADILLSLQNGYPINGKITANDDEKAYKIDVDKMSLVTLTMTSYIPYILISLEDKNGEQMALNWDFEGASAKKAKKWETSHYLAKGTYIVRIQKQSNMTGSYVLEANKKAVKVTEVEPNDTKKQAQNLLPNNTNIKGIVGWNDTTDFYKVTNLKKFATLEVVVTTGMPSLSVAVMRDNYSVIMSNDTFGNATNAKPKTWRQSLRVTKGTYYIQIQNSYRHFGLYNVTTNIKEMLPPPPTVKPLISGATRVNGQAIHSSKITLKIKGKVYTGKTNKKGVFNIKVPRLKEKTNVYVKVTSQYGTSDNTVVKVTKK